MEIKEALGKIDFNDDSHWTGDGLVQVSVVAKMVGRQLTRQEITDAWPEFNRSMEKADAEAQAQGHEEVVEEDPDAELREELAAVQEEIAEMNAGFDRAREHLLGLQKQEAHLIARLEQADTQRSGPKLARNVSGYIQAQNEARARRAAAANAIRETGITADMLTGNSQLDAALGNRPNPNQERKVRGQVVS